MAFLRSGLSVAFIICSCLLSIGAVQDASSDEVFTLIVAPPTFAKDVQLSYMNLFHGGGYGEGGSGGQSTPRTQYLASNKIRLNTHWPTNQPATALKLIAYAPGCQFVIVTVDDLSKSTREAEFRCQPLPVLQLRGRFEGIEFGKQELELRVEYHCGKPRTSPFGGLQLKVATTKVAADGAFDMDVPDFAADPSWPEISTDAELRFYVFDAKTGMYLAYLTSASGPAHDRGRILVASSYPEIVFVAHPYAESPTR
jgi:hypothetical protein